MTDRPLIDDRPIVSCEEDGYHECEGDPCRTCEMIEGRTTDRPLIDEVREALEVGAAGWHNTGRKFGHDGVWTECDLRFCKADRALLARLDGMTIVPTEEIERLREIEARFAPDPGAGFTSLDDDEEVEV